MPAVSIALATFNGAQFLEEQLDSLLGQTFTDLEIVISDDRSDDRTPEILQSYASRYPDTIRLHLHDTNVGYVRNFERCLQACNGDAILLCDQDDVWEPDKVAVLLDTLRTRGDLLVYSDAILVDTDNQQIHPSLWEHLGLRDIGDNRAGLYLRNAVTGCTCILERKLLSLALPIPGGFPVHDWWLAYVALQYGGLSRLDRRLTRYRQHAGNALGTNILKDKQTTSSHIPMAKRAWNRFVSPWKKNLERIAKSRIQARNFQLKVYAAFARFNEQHALDTSLSAVLAEWSQAYTRHIYLKEYQPFFDAHPELFMLVEDPTIMKKQVLKSMKLRQIKAVKAMLIYTLSLAGMIGISVSYLLD
jgi:glycosyltransferase involved in cell wall biosynthesis